VQSSYREQVWGTEVKTGVKTADRIRVGNCARRRDGEFGREGGNGVQEIFMALGIKSFLLNKYLLLHKYLPLNSHKIHLSRA